MTRRLWPLAYILVFYIAVSAYFDTFNLASFAGLVGGYVIGQVAGEAWKRWRRK